MSRLRAASAVALLLCWYVVAIVTIIALGWVGSSLYRAQAKAGTPNSGLGLCGATFVAVAVVVAYYLLRSVFTPTQTDPGSVELPVDWLPQLWDLIDDVATRLDTEPPARVMLTVEPNAAVEERTVMLGLVGGTRTLYIGVPLLLWLDEDELAAVLAHEFGHHMAGHAYYAAVTYRGTETLGKILDRTGKSRGVNRMFVWIAMRPLVGFAILYLRLTLRTRRTLELEADQVAAEYAGREVFVRALRRFHALSQSWGDFSARLLAPSVQTGVLPDDALAAYAHILADPEYQKDLERFGEAALPSMTSRYDSHPSLARRAGELGTNSGRQAGLLARTATFSGIDQHDVPAVATSLSRAMVWGTVRAPGDRPHVRPWRSWLTTVAGSADNLSVATLARAVREPGAQLETSGRHLLDTVVDFLETDGGTDWLTRRFVRVGPSKPLGERDARSMIASAVYTLAGRSLVARGKATWRIEWGCRARLASSDVSVENLRELIEGALTSPMRARLLRARLTQLGTGLETPTDRLPSAVVSASAVVDRVAWHKRRRLIIRLIAALIGLLIGVGTALTKGTGKG